MDALFLDLLRSQVLVVDLHQPYLKAATMQEPLIARLPIGELLIHREDSLPANGSFWQASSGVLVLPP